MILYFIRHAQSANNALWLRTGSNVGRSEDPELTATGQRQIEYLATYLKNWSQQPEPPDGDTKPIYIDYLYCSLMVRAVRTGTTVSRELNIPLVGWRDLHETGGIFLEDAETGKRVGQQGKTQAYFQQAYPGLSLPEDMNVTGWWNRPYEEEEEQLARAQRVLQRLLDLHGSKADRVAVVSHGGFFNVFLKNLLGLSIQENPWFLMNNTGISRIDIQDNAVTIAYLNRTDHLPPELTT
ncbi:MAG: histidine phosphatase family protein [Chloroflexi bacterium]|nr:histidine phosphatase family protein [Chloroflexota bacterium]